MKEIRQRFNAARKLYGHTDEISTASGIRIRGRYLLCESGTVTPSHDPLNGFCKSVGFPADRNGQTVNDRDYERDTDAQKITREIADNYDSRALQTPVVVSQDGIVLSGNGRTMAGILAAKRNTDAEYIAYVRRFAAKYGFKDADIDTFKHPRIVFVTDNEYDYTAETFAMFNAQEIKSQSKTEQAVKLGKLVDDETFNRLIRNINTFDTIGDFYNDVYATREAVNDLTKAGIISRMQYPEMFDGDTISQSAREILENVLIGKAFASNPDAVRQITAFKGIRKNIVTALAEISSNIALGDYSLESETAQAIALCYQARANGCFRQGDTVSGFARQVTMFGDSTTIADFTNVTVMLLADMMNHSQVTRLKKVFILYNQQAGDAANGQTDMFSTGSVRTKDEILTEIYGLFNYASQKELNAQISDATTARKCDAYSSMQVSEGNKSEVIRQTVNGCKVGDYVSLQLPCGEEITCKLEFISDGIAGIRLKGLVRVKVSDELVVPTTETTLSLPSWVSDTPKSRILDALLSYRKAA